MNNWFWVETLLYFMDQEKNIANDLDLCLDELAQDLEKIWSEKYLEVLKIRSYCSQAIWDHWEVVDHKTTREERLLKDATRSVRNAIRESCKRLRPIQRDREKHRGA